MMLDRISNKNKFYGVMIFTLLLCILAWYRSVSTTFEIMDKCSQLQLELDSTKADDQQLQSIKTELAELNLLIGSEQLSTDEINRGIVDFISGKVNSLNVVLTEFPSVHHYSENEYAIYTHQAVLQGNFSNLLQLVYTMEHEFEGARVCALRFYTVEEFRTKIKRLYSIIYIQNIKKHA